MDRQIWAVQHQLILMTLDRDVRRFSIPPHHFGPEWKLNLVCDGMDHGHRIPGRGVWKCSDDRLIKGGLTKERCQTRILSNSIEQVWTWVDADKHTRHCCDTTSTTANDICDQFQPLSVWLFQSSLCVQAIRPQYIKHPKWRNWRTIPSTRAKPRPWGPLCSSTVNTSSSSSSSPSLLSTQWEVWLSSDDDDKQHINSGYLEF